jgi:cardiolipin synthase
MNTPRSGSATRPARRAGRPYPMAAALGGLLASVLAALLGACAMTPPAPRADLPLALERRGAPAPAVRTVAREMEVIGHRGRLTAAERERLLKRIGEQGNATQVQRHLLAMSAFGEVDLYAGNAAKLLIDGPQTFAAMFGAIEKARSTVLLESYIIEDAAIAQRLSALLARKAAEGVRVAVLYDAVGSIGTDKAYFEGLKRAGISVCAFNPLNPVKAGRTGYWDITHRDHRKILSVDRQVAYTGGINISAVYSSGSFGRHTGQDSADDQAVKKDGWRDTQIELRGPAVLALDDLVREAWLQQKCPDALPPPPPPQPAAAAAPAGPHIVRVIPSSPDDPYNRIYALLLTAIDAAQQGVHLTMAYFAPGAEMIDALCEAAQRRVDVRLILPSVSDFSPVLHAGRSYYTRLLGCGVRLFELQDAVLHSKTAVIDGVVSTVGSSNLDWRSFTGNNEVNAVVVGDDFGDAMARMFQRDLAASQEITAQAWAKRPLLQRTKETLARLFEAWW